MAALANVSDLVIGGGGMGTYTIMPTEVNKLAHLLNPTLRARRELLREIRIACLHLQRIKLGGRFRSFRRSKFAQL